MNAEATKLIEFLSGQINRANNLYFSDRLHHFVLVTEKYYHIQTNGNGVNGTGWAILNLGALKDAKTFESKKESERNKDLYLVDADGNYIKQHITTLFEVLNREIETAQNVITFLKTNC